nr:hypothetical protein CFP56_76865 [Quercus suber]
MYRMTRSRTSDHPLPRNASFEGHSSDSESSTHLPIRACFEDLKRPENRQMLRQQLTGTFPETAAKAPRRPSNEVLSEKWSLKDRLSKKTLRLEVAELDAHSSSSTVNSVDVKRLSAVPEKVNVESIDIEKTITLLQELKKVATPSELVALHRALLPTKETEKVKSPAASPLDDRSSPPLAARRRSVLPPGLATRGGAAEDVLRKPNGARSPPSSSRPPKQGDWFTHVPAGSQNSLAALDLADDGANPVTTRLATPTNNTYVHTGVYQHGTLRVTNGAASPVPSIRPAPAVEAVREELRADGKPSLQSRATIDVMSAQTSKDSKAVRERIADLEKTGQYEAHPDGQVADMSSVAHHAPHHLTPFASARAVDRPTHYENDPRPRQKSSQRDAPVVSPTELDVDVPGTERRAMLNFASCLRSADNFDEHESDHLARSVAYARLDGSAGTKTTPTHSWARDGSQEHPRSNLQAHSNTSQKIDSGYSSDISIQALQSAVPQKDTPVQTAASSFAAKDPRPKHEIPSTRTEPPTETPPSAMVDPHKLSAARAQAGQAPEVSGGDNTFAGDEETVTALPTFPTTNAATAMDTIRNRIGGRAQKKLQKNMPPNVKYRRKLEAERKKQAKLTEQFNQPLSASEIVFSTEDLQKAADLLGDGDPDTEAVSGQQAQAPPRRSRSQSRDKKRNSRQMMSTSDWPRPETSWRSRLRSKSQSRGKSQVRPPVTDDSDGEDTATHSASLPSREEVRILIGSSIHTDLYPPSTATDTINAPVSPIEVKHVSLPLIAGTMQHQHSMSRSSTERAKSKSIGGMSEAAASKLARAKSKDRMPPTHDRPRTVTPTRSSPKVSTFTDFGPEVLPTSHSKAETPSSRPMNRNSLYAESIPPLPELPPGVEMKANKAGELVVKRVKSSPRASMLTAARSSLVNSACDTSVEDQQTLNRDTPEMPSQRSSREVLPSPGSASRPSSDRAQQAGGEVERGTRAQGAKPENDLPASPTRASWEVQAKLWRQRRLSIGATLGQAILDDDDEKPPVVRQASATTISAPSAPAIVVTRHVTPLSEDSKSRQNVGRGTKDQASVHADSYIELLGKENRPRQSDIPRTNSSDSFVTAFDKPQSSRYPPPTEDRTAATAIRRTPSGRVRTESGIWRPYSPQHASDAERSRAISLAKLTGELHDDASAPPMFDHRPRHSDSPSKSTDSLLDRYSGGLGYNWDFGSGFNGSAGTRVSGGRPTSSKGVPMSEAFGLDLNDVPVILRRVL